MQQTGVRSSRADLRVHLDDLHKLYNSTNEEVFSRLGLLSPPSKRPETQTKMYPTSPLVTAAALMVEEEEEESVPRQFTRPRPTGNLFFYRPQSEARTPQEQAQLAAGPLSTPDSPSMVCSGNSEIEDDDGWSCHKKEKEQEDTMTIKSQQQQQQGKANSASFSDAFPFAIPSQNKNNNNNTGRPAIKKDTAALDLILKKAAVFLSPLPPEKENNFEEEGEKKKHIIDDEIAVEQEQMTPAMPIVPRVLAFDEIDEDVEEAGRHSLPSVTAANLNEPLVIPNAPAASNNALNRLKQKTLERQSSHVAAFTKLKQLTVQKQRHRVATATRPSSSNVMSGGFNGPNSESNNYNNSNSNSVSDEIKKCFQTPMPPAAPAAPQLITKRAIPPPVFHQNSDAPTTTEKRRPTTSSANTATTEEAVTTGKKAYLKRRTQAVPILHQGVPDWSAVKPRTQSKLDSNLILRNKSGTGTGAGTASIARPGNVSRHTHVPNGNIETMEQYTAQYHHHQNSSGGGNNSVIDNRGRDKTGPLSSAASGASAGAMGPLAQGKPAPYNSTGAAGAPPQRRGVVQRALKPFDPTSIAIAPAAAVSRGRSGAAFGPLGAAALAAGGTGTGTGRSNHVTQYHSQYSHSTTQSHSNSVSREYDPHMEDPLRPLVSQVDELLNSVGRAIRR